MEIEKYKINITGSKIVPIGGYKTFATDKSSFKIYIIKFNSDILYVGMTKQRISERFAQSFRAYIQKLQTGESNSSGDSGYKWLKEHINTKNDLELFVLPFTAIQEKNYIEAVEAEIAFLVRTKNGRWPEFQNEIHFHNIEGFNANKIAKSILKEVCNWELD